MIKTILAFTAALFLILPGPAKAAGTEPVVADVAKSVAPQPGEVGAAAPNFTATDSNGKSVSLSDFRGKTIVLEWTNNECPFVRKFYDTNTMQDMQKDATDRGVVWLSIVSSAEGKQGFTTPDEAKKVIAKEKSHETARLLDPTGQIGHLYHATNTPQMFVIDSSGTLVYAGAMDDQSSVAHDSIKTANNYVKAALADLSAGKPVAVSSSKPYGCGIKY